MSKWVYSWIVEWLSHNAVLFTVSNFKRLGLVETVRGLGIILDLKSNISLSWSQLVSSWTWMSYLLSSNKYFSILFSLTLICVHFYHMYSVYQMVNGSCFNVLLIKFALRLYLIQTIKLHVITIYLLLDQNGWGSSLKALNYSWITKRLSNRITLKYYNCKNV